MIGGSSILLDVAVAVASVMLSVGVFWGIVVVVVVANRAEPDPTGRRPTAVYCFAASFLSLWLALLGSFVVVVALVGLIGTTHATTFVTPILGGARSSGAFQLMQRGPIHPVGDAAARAAVLGGLILLVADASFVFHRRRGLGLVNQGTGGGGDPVARVALSYTSSVAFLAVFLLVVSVVVTAYSVFRVVAPGVFDYGGSTTAAVHVLLDAAYLVIASGLILVRDLRLGASLRAAGALSPAGSEAAPPTPEPAGPTST